MISMYYSMIDSRSEKKSNTYIAMSIFDTLGSFTSSSCPNLMFFYNHHVYDNNCFFGLLLCILCLPCINMNWTKLNWLFFEMGFGGNRRRYTTTFEIWNFKSKRWSWHWRRGLSIDVVSGGWKARIVDRGWMARLTHMDACCMHMVGREWVS